MAYISTTKAWDTINSITHPKISQKISDNITGRIPFIYFLNRIGHKEYEDGGLNYILPVFKELSSATAYTGNTVLTSPEGDPFTVAIYERKQLEVPIVVTGTKLLQNSGSNPEAVVDYVTSVVEAAEQAMYDALGGSTYGVFSTNGESDLGVTGLGNLLPASTTTGTAGGLDRATYSFWRHQTDSVSTGFNTDGLASMSTLFYACARGDECPQLVILTRTGFANFDRALVGTIQYNQPVGPNVADAGYSFPHLYFKNAVCIFDDGVPTNQGYFLNLKYAKLLVSRDRDMTIRDFITPSDQDSLVGRIYWAGNLVMSNMARQGLLTGSIETWA